MVKITINGVEIECRDGIAVLQAALEADIDVPFYCYHPGLTVVASCRLCLMEMKAKDPKTGQMAWAPRLAPSCQTPAREGMEIRFHSDNVRRNQRAVMEHYLLNHPLDCPVCDQAGECWLQDYSFKFGNALSRMAEPKIVNPKKDIGPRTLLYQDRCVLCSRCVRFTREISGTAELCVIRRSAYAEIDVFPGLPLANKLQGNVVDLCPVGALLDKDFLFQQRVWYLKTARSVCPNCATGCTIHVDHSNGRLWRLRPRTNPKVNTWWICDEGRFGWKYVHSNQRLLRPSVRRDGRLAPVTWEDAMAAARRELAAAATVQDKTLAVMLSPMMACEEAWLLVQAVRKIAPQAVLVPGPVPRNAADELFPVGARDEAKAKFIIRAEKCPNRRGIEAVASGAGGPHRGFDEFLRDAAQGRYGLAWIAGGYWQEWVTRPIADALARVDRLVVQELFPSDLAARATVLLPSCAWVEREGTFINLQGVAQPFERALPPPLSCQSDGQYLHRLAGFEGLYRAARVREMMRAQVPAVREVYIPPPETRVMH